MMHTDPQSKKFRQKMLAAQSALNEAKQAYESAQKKYAEARFDFYSHIDHQAIARERDQQREQEAAKAARELAIESKRKELEDALGARVVRCY
jgi:hypothetical protein